jgi:Bacterial regulatory helix-turn-helix protein, lysR family
VSPLGHPLADAPRNEKGTSQVDIDLLTRLKQAAARAQTPPHNARLDLANGHHIGPGKTALLEAIRAKGSITAAARHLGMSYRRAWFLVENINDALRKPAVTSLAKKADSGHMEPYPACLK